MDYFDSSVANSSPESASAISEDVNDTSYASQGYDYSVLAGTYTPEQIDDFRGSAIDPALVLLNCRRLRRQDEMIRALRKIDRSNQTANGQGLLSQFIKRQPIEWTEGGVGFWGYLDTTTAVQVKPDNPQIDRKGKARKYESPAGLPPRLMIPRVTPQIWQRIAQRVNVPIGVFTDYRDWLIAHPQIWIGQNEGFKKVLSTTSQGYPAIGFTGINGWSGARENDWEMRELIPDLKPFVVQGRHFVNLYDCDQSARTIATVNKEVEALAKILIGQGCTVSRATWDASNKGIDDLICNCGAKIVERVISDSKPITLVSIDSSQKKPAENIVGEAIAKEYKKRLFYCSELKEWYWYEKSGKWVVQNLDEIDAFFRYEIEKTVPNYGTTNYANNVINAARSKLMKKTWKEASSLEYTPFQNGVLNLKTFELEPHKPEFYFRWQLAYDYNVLSTCEVFQAWLVESMKGDNAKVELIRAYTKAIVTGQKKLQRYMEFIGVGGSGKTTLINVIAALVGMDNCCFTDLIRIETDKFEAANYVDKRLIIVTDSDHYVGSVTKLKAIVGGDLAKSERKFKDAVSAKSIGMLLVAANEAIKSNDYTSGLGRRRISVPFLNLVRTDKRRQLMDIDGDGSVSGEFAPLLAGIYNWAISMPDETVKNLIVNTETSVPSLHSFSRDILLATNPLADWLDANVIFEPGYRSQIGSANEAKVSHNDGNGTTTTQIEYANVHKWLYANYRQWYSSNGGNKPIIRQRFRDLLYDLCAAQLRAEVQAGRDRDGAYLIGLRLRCDEDSMPLSVTGESPVVTNRDEPVTKKNGSGDECDECDELSIKSSQLIEDVVVLSPQQQQEESYSRELKDDVRSSHSSQRDGEPVPFVTGSLQVRHGFVTTDEIQFKVGNLVEYIGTKKVEKEQYAGVLKIYELHPNENKYTCMKSCGQSLTSRIDAEDLRLISK